MGGRRRAALGAVALATLLVAAPLAGQASYQAGGDAPPAGSGDPRAEYPVEPVVEGVRVDGVLDEAVWTSATRIPLPWETDPGDNVPAPVETACWAAFDPEHLFLACSAADPRPAEIRAFVTDRDDITGHDRIVFTLDPFNDARRAFQFGVSALGVQFDAVVASGSASNGGGGSTLPADPSWDAIWNSAGRINGGGYAVEAAIPFKSLRFPSADEPQRWGFYASRYWPRSQVVETRSTPWNRNDACVLCQANTLAGLRGIAPGTNVELTPSLVAGRTDERTDLAAGPLEAGPTEAEVGLDAVWGVTSNWTVNATLNPDFSQVEADAPQLDVNNRFSLFFPEKRSFFLEGADFFQTPVQAVFTRTVVDPSFGAKVTGKVGANAAGAMFTRDEVNVLTFPGSQSSDGTTLEQEVTTTVARLRRDVGSSSTVGALLTGREGGEYHNRVVGVDGLVRPLGALTVRAQALRSVTAYPVETAREFDQPDGSFGGTALDLSADWDTREWSGRFGTRRLDSGFRADAGFLNQVDFQHWSGMLERRWWSDGADWFTRLATTLGFWHDGSTSGELVGEGVWGVLDWQGPAQSALWVNPNLRRQRFEGTTYEFAELWVGGGTRPSGALSLNLVAVGGGTVDYANGRAADQFRLSPSATIRIGRRTDLRLNHTWLRLTTGDERILTANVSQVRGVYNFTPRAFVRAIVQVRDTDRTPSLWAEDVEPSSTALFTQLLFSYKLNPQSVVFLGYTDGREAAITPAREEIPLTQASRSFFLKLAYAWRP